MHTFEMNDLNVHYCKTTSVKRLSAIGARAGGVRGAAAPPNFGQLRFLGQQEKIWAKPTFKDVSCFFMSILER